MRKKIVAGNWKMNTDLQEAIELAKNINEKVSKTKNIDGVGVYISPPFTNLAEVSKLIDNQKITLTAQNCATDASGAFTGEISAKMLKSIGVKAIILGHSERRAYYGDSNAVLVKKMAQVLENGLEPIFCCGEQLNERETNVHFDVIQSQLKKVVFELSADDFAKVVIAYEPVWAIGTGKTASSEQAQEIHKFIRNLIAEKYGNKIANDTTILYGGSCKPSNAEELFVQADVDGGLIGGASLKAEDFLGIITAPSLLK